ncbi:hypothetical protein ACWFRJ_11030 [Streptomyces sp. NPDC055239]
MAEGALLITLPDVSFGSGVPGEQSANGWAITLSCFGVIGAFVLLVLLVTAITYGLRRKSAWSLRVGPEGITTTSAVDYDRREYPWDHLQRFTIEEVAAGNPGWRYSGLHVEYTKDAGRSAKRHRPAGFSNIGGGNLIVRKDGVVPVCVLGPMTDRQRADLGEALARYGKQR